MLTFKVRLEKALGGSGPSLSEQELIIPSSATVQVLKSQIISQLPSLHSQNPASLSLVLRSNNECIGADNAVLNQIPLLKNDATAAPIELRVVIGTKKKNKKNNTDKAEKEGVAFAAVPPPQREPINITTKREAASAALSNVTNRVPTNNVTNRPPIRRTSSVWRMSSVLEDGKKVWLQERNSQRECCFKCGKEVYWNERITVGQHVVVHKACFKCQKCGKRLAPGDYHSLVDDFYCKPHYDQVTLRIKARINRIAVPPSWKQQQPPQSPSASRVHLSKFQLQAQRKEREQRKEEEMEKARKQQEEMQQQQQLIEDANKSTKDDQQQNNSSNNSELEASVSSGSEGPLKDQVPITEELESQLLSNIIESLATKADIQSPGQVLRARYLTPRTSFDGEGDGVISPISPTELNSNTDSNDNKEEVSAESQPKDESMVDMPIPDDLFDSSGDRPLSVMINEGERTLNYIRLLDLMTEPDLLIAQAVCFTVPHGYRDKINPRIVNFYMHHDLCVDLMISLVRTEIEASSEVGTLFRTNGSVSNLLSFFAKTIGLTFLRKTLGPIIQAILSSVKKGIQYELDDNRLEEQGVKDIKKQKKKNSQNVVLAAESFLAEIDEGLDRFPLGIRRICHELRLGTMAKYPDNVYSILGGFLFLRFICPCIIAAQHYGIVDCKVSDEGQRALILVSKTLQQLANGMVFGKKEEYMTILNPFLERNFTPLHDFFDEISTLPEDTAEQVSDKVVLDVEEMEEMKTMFHFMVHQSMDDIRKHIKSQKTVDPLLLGVKIAQLEELEDCMGKLGKPEDDLTHSGAGRLSLLTRGRPAVAPHSRAIVVTSPAGSRRNPHNAVEDDEEEEDEEDEALSTINVNEFENLDDVVSYLYNKDKAKRLKKEQERQQRIQAKKEEKRRVREVQTKKRAEFAIKCIEEKYFRQSLYRLNAGLDISPPTSSSAPASPSKSQEPGGKAVNNNNNNIHSSTGWRGSAIISEGNPNISLPKSAAKVISISQRVKSGMSIEDIEKEVAMVIDQMIEPMSSPRTNDGNAFKLEPLALGNTSGKKKRGGSFVMSKKRSSTPRGEKKKERSFSTRRKGSCVALMDSDDGGFSSGVENEFEQQGEERKKKEDKRHLHGSVVTRSGPVKAAKQKKKSGSVSGRSPSFRRLKSSRDNKQDYALPKDMKMKLKLTNEWEKEKEKKREEARMAATGTGGGSGSASGTTIEPEVTHSPRARLAATKKTSASLRDLVSLVGEWEMEDSADSSSPTLMKRNRAATALVQSSSSVEREKEEEEEEEEEEEDEGEGEREVEAEGDDDSLFEEESDESDGGGAETLLQKYFSTTPRGTHILEDGGDEGRTQTNERKTKRERRKSRRQVLTPEKAASLPLHALRMAAAPEGRANGDEEDFQFFG